MKPLARLWRDQRWPLLAFAAAAALTLFFGIRMILFTLYWADPAHRNQGIEGWMTPGYAARSWEVPTEVVDAALGLTREKGHPMTFEQIARDRGVPLSEIIAQVEAAVTKARAQAPRP